MSLPFFDGPQLEATLKWPDLIAAMGNAFSGVSETPPRSHHTIGDDSFLVMPAWVAGRFTGAKLVTIHRKNRAKGLPTIHGLYALFSGETGAPLAVLDGRALTLLRTAATSAFAASLLAPAESKRHLVVGAGALAPYLVQAIATVRLISEVLIWNRSEANADAVVHRLRAEGFNCHVAPDLSDAVGSADIISTATQSTSPLVRGTDLTGNTHLDLVGAYTPEMAEADPDALAGARIVVDTWEGAREEAGDLIQAVACDALAWDEVDGDLADLATGRIAARGESGGTTAFKSVGASIEDLAAASLAWKLLGVSAS